MIQKQTLSYEVLVAKMVVKNNNNKVNSVPLPMIENKRTEMMSPLAKQIFSASVQRTQLFQHVCKCS